MNKIQSNIATSSLGNFIKALFSKRVLNIPYGLYTKYLKRHYVTEGLKFEIPREQCSFRFCARFYKDDWERKERELVKEHIREDDRVLELGGCIGVVSCITDKLLKSPKARHVVIEANPELMPTLYRNRALNDCNFVIEHGVAGDEREYEFFIHELIVGGSAKRKTEKRHKIIGRSIRELERIHGEFNVLIMDIEGSEYELIKNSKDVLRHFRLIIMDLHDFIIGSERAQECKEMLRGLGFDVRQAEGCGAVVARVMCS